VVESDAPLRREYRPGHPKADASGYVDMPNVNPVEEMVDMISASRSYQTNVQMMNVSRQLVLATLDLGK
jgi:flagellar basal-body rod protein FlgC